jgi:hypothetical protein
VTISNLAGEIGGTPALANEGPIPDPHGGYVPVVAENAQGAGVKQEVLPGARRRPDPARYEYAQHVPVGEQRNVAIDRAGPGYHTVHPRTHLLGRSPDTATAEDLRRFQLSKGVVVVPSSL